MLSRKEIQRYSRQIIEIGEKGQEKLKKSKALLVGIGGIGSAISTYLVRAGIGEIRIADSDFVSLSDIHRQILYDENDIGKLKVKVAKEKLKRMNRKVKVKTFAKRVTFENIMKIAEDVDIILDGSDNLGTRFVMNKAAIKLKIPFIHSGAQNERGICAVFLPKKACFSCLYQNKERKGSVGILGPAAGISGCLSAMNAINILTGELKLKNSFAIYFSLKEPKFHLLEIKRNPKCRECR